MESNKEPKKTVNKKLIGITVAIAAAACIAAAAVIFVAGSGTEKRLAEQLDLAERYLSELDYESAIAAYEAAIEIDPKAEDAYKGLADAYIGLGDYESAKEALERGIEETDSESLVEYLAQIEVKLQEIAETQSPSQSESESQSQSESQSESQSQSELQSYLQEISVQGAMLESYGNAYGGVMPVKMDGRWGAIDYENNVIVPCEYDGFYSPDKLGNVVFYNPTGNDTWGQEYEYYLFDKQGTLIYQGNDEVKASGGMYITIGEYKTYYRLDGTVVLSLSEGMSDVINPFYDGISILYAPSGSNVINSRFDGSGEAYIGTVDMQGNVSWRDAPSDGPYYFPYDGNVISTMNHGYYIRSETYVRPPSLTIHDEYDSYVAMIDLWCMYVDKNGRVSIGNYDDYYADKWNEDNSYRGFYVDGGYIWNYGSHMVFIVDGKDVLVDFSNNTGDAEALDSDEIVTAVYDYIFMADENYWLVQSGDQWGYIDHDGNEMGMFEDAGEFVNGYALIIEDGEAWLINEEFERLENLGQADSVSSVGELYSISIGDEIHFYQFD